MNNQQLATFAYMQAAVARVKGMEAANQQAVVDGSQIPFTLKDFHQEAQGLGVLAVQALNLPE